LEPTPLSQAQVTVKRARAAAPVLTAEAQGGSTLANQMTGPGPRVFRVQAAQTFEPPQLQTPSPPADEPNPAPPVDLPRSDRPKPQTAGRSSRTATHKQPGPVLHLVHSIPPRPDPESEQPQFGLWAAEMTRIGIVLDDIKRAQSFTFIDDDVAAEWRRLSRAASALHLEIKAQLL
jgi:hypothetical protein